ncbi:MAG: CAP domain-containing protein, partial [Solirubrobacteraceae bacterium]
MLHDVHRRRRRLAITLGVAATAGGLSAPAAVAGCHGDGGRAAVLCLVNRERTQHGLGPLERDRRLARAARRHARDMVRHGYFAHQRSGGPDLGARLRRAGWRGTASGEAIAYG